MDCYAGFSAAGFLFSNRISPSTTFGVKEFCMGYFKDLREHLAALDKAGLLVKIDEQINKDTELMPLVRWQFRGLSEEERRAFMFTNVVDAKGRKYDIPVVVGTLAASRQIYGFGLQCKPEEIVDRWNQAQSQPIAPKIVEDAPVHEIVYQGSSLMEKGGLGEFPIPIGSRKIPKPASSISATTAAM
jgi:3-polyprenyl-4-hydroxybenzoate decarboxylase